MQLKLTVMRLNSSLVTLSWFTWNLCSEYYDCANISKAQKVRITFLSYHQSLLITFIIGIFFGKIVIKYN